MPQALDLAGKQFGRLLVIRRQKVAGARNVMWLCQCQCGNFTVAAAANIGKTTLSCGCFAEETARDLLRGNTYKRTHNLSQSPEYRVWTKMKLRCHDPENPRYPEWGGRGIKVCIRWRDSFENFFTDMGRRPSPRHSIDRIDNDGDYKPGNCRWAFAAQQARNTRLTHWVTIDGRRLCVKDWCYFMNVPRDAVYALTRARRKTNRPPRAANSEEAVNILYRKHVLRLM
jgi:hypothetical protein